MKQNLKLLVAIREKGLTQKAFAELVRINPTIVSLVLRGRFILDEDQKVKFAEALGKNPDELFN
jgi:transcriptional regulator with XRE-family HTH domain